MKSLHARRRVIGAMFMAGVFSIGLPFDMAPLPGNCAVAAAASEVSGDTIAIRDVRATADYWINRNYEGDKVCLIGMRSWL